MALTEEKFNQGMSTQEYIDQIKVNKQPFLDIYNALDVPAKVKSQFDDLAEPLRLAVFTADWCGDAVSTTPTILRMAESTSKLSVKVFNRDDELELTNSFLPENRAGTVPVFVVLDSSMKEIARFVETAGELVPSIDAMDGVIAQDSLPQEDPLGWLVHDDVDSVIDAAYKFAADHPAISTVLTGTSSLPHLEDNVRALEIPTLPEADKRRIREVLGEIAVYI